MNLIAHLVRKDVRRCWMVFFLFLALVLLRTVLEGWEKATVAEGGSISGSVTALYTLVPLTQLILLVIILPFLLQLDPLVGTSAFWLTRPISGGALLAGKCLTVGLLLILPAVIGRMAVFRLNGLPSEFFTSALAETLMQQFLLVTVIVVFAVLTPNFSRFALAGGVALGGLILVLVVVLSLASSRYCETLKTEGFSQQPAGLQVSRQLVAGSLFLLLLGATIVHQYLTRRRGRSILILLLGLLLLSQLPGKWRWNLFQPSEAPAAPSGFEAAKTRVSLKPGTVSISDSSFFCDEAPSQQISAQLIFQGIPERLGVAASTVRARLSLESGREVESTLALRASSPIPRVVSADTHWRALGAALGGARVYGRKGDYAGPYSSVPLFTVDDTVLATHAGEAGTLSALLDTRLYRFEVMGEVSFREGARLVNGSKSVEIVRKSRFPGGSSAFLRRVEFDFLLTPGASSNPGFQQGPLYLLHNPALGEAFLPRIRRDKSALGPGGYSGFGWSITSGTMMRINYMTLLFGGDEGGRQATPRIDPEWLANARLVWVRAREVLRFKKPLRVDRFPLRPPGGDVDG